MDIKRWAVLDLTKKYRYALGRSRDEGEGQVLFVMLNPSTANADIDDPTIRRVMGLSWAWGFKDAAVVNLFAFRATDPKDLYKSSSNIIGPVNDIYIRVISKKANLIVAAWGAISRKSPETLARADRVMCLLRESGVKVVCLSRTKNGDPRHPLYHRNIEATALENYGYDVPGPSLGDGLVSVLP